MSTEFKASNMVMVTPLQGNVDIGSVYHVLPLSSPKSVTGDPIQIISGSREKVPYFGASNTIVAIRHNGQSRGIRTGQGQLSNVVSIDLQCYQKNIHLKLSNSNIQLTGALSEEMGSGASQILCEHLNMAQSHIEYMRGLSPEIKSQTLSWVLNVTKRRPMNYPGKGADLQTPDSTVSEERFLDPSRNSSSQVSIRRFQNPIVEQSLCLDDLQNVIKSQRRASNVSRDSLLGASSSSGVPAPRNLSSRGDDDRPEPLGSTLFRGTGRVLDVTIFRGGPPIPLPFPKVHLPVSRGQYPPMSTEVPGVIKSPIGIGGILRRSVDAPDTSRTSIKNSSPSPVDVNLGPAEVSPSEIEYLVKEVTPELFEQCPINLDQRMARFLLVHTFGCHSYIEYRSRVNNLLQINFVCTPNLQPGPSKVSNSVYNYMAPIKPPLPLLEITNFLLHKQLDVSYHNWNGRYVNISIPILPSSSVPSTPRPPILNSNSSTFNGSVSDTNESRRSINALMSSDGNMQHIGKGGLPLSARDSEAREVDSDLVEDDSLIVSDDEPDDSELSKSKIKIYAHRFNLYSRGSIRQSSPTTHDQAYAACLKVITVLREFEAQKCLQSI